MKKRLFIIMGESSSGKDTVAHICQNKFDMRPVISYATRPKRPNEKEGREHYFIDDAKMAELKSRDDMVAYTYIKNPNSDAKGYEYCAMLENVQNADMYVLDPLGYDDMMRRYGDYFETIRLLITAPYEVRRQRAIERGIKDIKEFEERYENEREQFEDALVNQKYDYLIDNSNITKNELEEKVKDILRKTGFI